jgi:hypothetical protein
MLDFDLFADSFFRTRAKFKDFYDSNYFSIVNSECLLLYEYFEDLEQHLPIEYRMDMISDGRAVDRSGDSDLDLYRATKHMLFAQLEISDLFIVLAGLYDLKSKQFVVDFLMENDKNLKYDDPAGIFYPMVHISRESFALFAKNWQNFLALYYKVVFSLRFAF